MHCYLIYSLVLPHQCTCAYRSGFKYNRVYLMEKMNIKNEMYLSLLTNRATGGPVMVGSPRGGTSIEDVAESNPELIFTEAIVITVGLTSEDVERMASNLELEAGSDIHAHAKAVKIISNLYDMFIKCDCKQVESNPFAELPDGDIMVCDAKPTFVIRQFTRRGIRRRKAYGR